jgi:hypothetical protein
MSEAQRARSELGLAYRRRNSTPEQIAEARRNLTEANLTARIREAVAAWPPLTDAQRERLALLLHPGSGDAAA